MSIIEAITSPRVSDKLQNDIDTTRSILVYVEHDKSKIFGVDPHIYYSFWEIRKNKSA